MACGHGETGPCEMCRQEQALGRRRIKSQGEGTRGARGRRGAASPNPDGRGGVPRKDTRVPRRKW